MVTTSQTDHDLTLLYRARALADAAVICDIESEGYIHIDANEQRWYDTRPLLDPREQPDECIDMFREALDYAFARRLISAMPSAPHLVRINPRGLVP